MTHRTIATGLSLSTLALVALLGCGDKGGGAASGSAIAASASSAPPACNTAPKAEQEKRCDAGENACCTILLDAAKPTDANYDDIAGKACGAGNEHACEAVRDRPIDTLKKLDALEKACVTVDRWTCRLASQLAVVAAPDRFPKIFDSACKHSGDSEMTIGGQIVKCQGFDAAKLNDMLPNAKSCKEGDLAGCKALAGVDGAAYDIFAQIAWQARGVVPDVANKNRVEHDYLGATIDTSAPLKGKATFTFTDAGSLDKKALGDQLTKNAENVQRCLAWAIEHDPTTAGDLELEVDIDKSGRIAFAKEKEDKVKTRTDLVQCARHRMQDVSVTGPQPAPVNAILKVHFSK